MERDDVIKALKWCSELRLCVDCPMRAEGYFSHSCNDCKKALAEKAISLIRELTEENARLSFFNAQKAEAVREHTIRRFVESLREKAELVYFDKNERFWDDMVSIKDVENIAQELLGGEQK